MPVEPPEAENIKVIVRCRPMNESEIAANYENIVDIKSDEGSLTLRNPSASEYDPPKTFTFDTVFDIDSSQLDVYNLAARPIVDNVLEGYNGTIFAYGQTGTGKTHTMEGNRNIPEQKGIIPNSFAHIFGHIAKSEGDKRFLVRATYLEIYNEEVRDLLGKDQSIRLEVKERPDIGVYVRNLTGIIVNNADDLDRIMTLGSKNRVVGATNMNLHSSRSHAIFSITVESCEEGADGKEHIRAGKLHLVDLAGSERQSKTGSSGQRLVEATKINLSLSTLGNVISALVDGKSTHIPYRNSKLTRLLQDSLGGNSKTLMCANIGPAAYNYDESLSTLRYSNRAKNIKNKARINEDPKDTMIKKFEDEIEELRKQLEEGGSEGATESGDDASDNGTGETKKAHRKRGYSEEEIRSMREEIDVDRHKLAERKDIIDEERTKISDELEKREQVLNGMKLDHDSLLHKLQGMEKKIIIGGENLLEKAQEQDRLLEESSRELENRKKKEIDLKKALLEKESERLNIEEKYSSLQDEATGKTKKLKKVWQMTLSAKNELNDLRQEHQREMEGLLDNIRQLDRELSLNKLIIDMFIPPEYQEVIERAVQWNEDIGEYQLKCVAYTGNNMRKQLPVADKEKKKEADTLDLTHAYLSYNFENPTRIPMRLKSSRGKARAYSSRPKSSKKSSYG